MEEGVSCIVEAEIEGIWLCRSAVHVGPVSAVLVSPRLAVDTSLVSSTPSLPTAGTYFPFSPLGS